MKTQIVRCIALMLGAVMASASVQAGQSAKARAATPVCTPVVRDAWIRLLPNGMPMHAGFASIENVCDAPVRIVGVRSGNYRAIELHETTLVNGVSRMRQLRELAIAPGQRVELKPGGLHLMLMQPQGVPLTPGVYAILTFVYGDGNTHDVLFLAKSATPR